MTTTTRRLITLTLAATALLTAAPAHAVLQDHGPLNAATGFPTWYRDSNGVPLEMCLAQTPSPNAAALGSPMCFPPAPNPAGFAGNFGDEAFYAVGDAVLQGPGFTARLVTALESAYANGVPRKGDEIVFARIRIVMSVTAPGTYTVTHPFGVEIFPDVEPGPRAVFFTSDVGVSPGNFDLALGGAVGPFLQWSGLNFDETLTVVNAQGVTEEYLGDPNIAHTVTGSPFTTNYFQVEGPVGSDIGAGSDVARTDLFNVVGKRYTAPIPTPLAIERASYSRTAAASSIDVFARANTGQTLLVSGAGIGSLVMKPLGNGKYVAHYEYAADALLPGFVTVTNLTDTLTLNAVTARVTDVVEISSATFDPFTNTLVVTASSSDQLAPPALDVLGFPIPPNQASNMVAGSFSTLIPSGVPPSVVQVVSSAGGSHADLVQFLQTQPGNPVSPPAADSDAVTTPQNTAVTIDVTANDLPANAGLGAIIVSYPANGTVALAATTGSITYTPRANTFGDDTFTYAAVDATGAISNVATVTVHVTFVPVAPTTVADTSTVARGAAGKVIDVLANDRAATNTIIDPATLELGSAPAQGTATVSAGKIVYTPNATFSGTVTFTYRVRNDFGTLSSAATVTVTVFPNAEVISNIRSTYTTSQRRWVITGNSSWFGNNVNNTVSCYNSTTLSDATTLIATVPVQNTGAWQIQAVPSPVAPVGTRNVRCTSTGGGTATAGTSVR